MLECDDNWAQACDRVIVVVATRRRGWWMLAVASAIGSTVTDV